MKILKLTKDQVEELNHINNMVIEQKDKYYELERQFNDICRRMFGKDKDYSLHSFRPFQVVEDYLVVRENFDF